MGWVCREAVGCRQESYQRTSRFRLQRGGWEEFGTAPARFQGSDPTLPSPPAFLSRSSHSQADPFARGSVAIAGLHPSGLDAQEHHVLLQCMGSLISHASQPITGLRPYLKSKTHKSFVTAALPVVRSQGCFLENGMVNSLRVTLSLSLRIHAYWELSCGRSTQASSCLSSWRHLVLAFGWTLTPFLQRCVTRSPILTWN